ncbi:MAG: FliM/FliN family flagellar motor switch protein [bacterium]
MSDSTSVLPLLDASPRPAGRPMFSSSSLADLRLRVDVPLGSYDVDLRGLLQLKPGSVLSLDTQTGESLDIRVNGTTVARGEVRIHGEHFAVRVTEILRAGLPNGEGLDGTTHAPRST